MSKHPVRDGIGLSIGVLIYVGVLIVALPVENLAPKK